jgi:hypothetical protein
LAAAEMEPTVTDMYTISISVLGTDPETSLRPDLESTLQSVEKSLLDRVEPGRAVRWEISCPSGRTAVGDLTVNTVDGGGRHEIAEHIELVCGVLTEEARDEWPRA